MVNVQRYILDSFFLSFKFWREEQEQAEQKKKKNNKKQSPVEQEVKLPES